MNKGKSIVMEEDEDHQDNCTRGVTNHPPMLQKPTNSSIFIGSTDVPNTFGGQPSAAATHPLAVPPLQPQQLCSSAIQSPLPLQRGVVRIMRKALPCNAKIATGAKSFMQECVSNFITYVSNEAKERCIEENRSIVTAEDILLAFKNLGFSNYSDLLSVYLDRYRESTGRGQLAANHGNHEPHSPAPVVDPAASGDEGEVDGYKVTLCEVAKFLGVEWNEPTDEGVNDDTGKGDMTGVDGGARV